MSPLPETSTRRKVRDKLRERGIMVNARGGGLRVSPHFYNTEAELMRFFQAL